MKKIKNSKGITLIALIITIVVLLVLAVVAIQEVRGEGIISKAKYAAKQHQIEQEKEEIQLALNEWKIQKNLPNPGTFIDFMQQKLVGASVVAEGNNLKITMKSGRVYTVTESGTITFQGETSGGGTAEPPIVGLAPGLYGVNGEFTDWPTLVDPDSGAITMSETEVTGHSNDVNLEGSLVIDNSVTSIGDGAFEDCFSLTSITIGNRVATIGNYAFSRCAVTNITIPDSVTSIGDGAFSGCWNLTSITIGNRVATIGNYAFNECDNLTSITIPDSVTSIGENAFEGIINVTYNGTASGSPWGARYVNAYIEGDLMFSDSTKTNLLNCSQTATGEITIPDTVTTIENYAFNGCDNLTSITIPNSVTSIGENAFENCYNLTSITIGNGITTIGNRVFSNCAVTNITIPDSVTSIGENAFSGCWNLTSITIPNSVTSIGENAFGHCFNLTSITIGNSVTTIGNYAFNECDNLTSITIPDSVTTIGNYAFNECDNLTSITIPDSVTTIGEGAFEGIINVTYNGTASGSPWGARYVNAYIEGDLMFSDSTKTNLIKCSQTATGEITIPDTVTTIENYAFNRCDNLTSITIPNSVTTIGNWAFNECDNLTSITIPDSVTTIGEGAFGNCFNLTSITIPDSVTTIGDNAFFGIINVIYNGTASGSPWGARCVNAYIEGDLMFSDSTKANLIKCSQTATGEITIPDGVKTILDNAFEACNDITNIIIPNSVTTIGNYAFNGCDNLTSITIPDSVTSIGEMPFGWTAWYLTSITWKGNTYGSQDEFLAAFNAQ